MPATPAPELVTSEWFGVDRPLSLADLRGRVVLIEAFQMLCPACVSHGIPLMAKARATFAEDDLVVIGLHSVFEHHAVMTPAALRAFLHEYRVHVPVAVDAPGDGALPATMAAYDMQGTPTTLLIDRAGNLRHHHFGVVDPLRLGGKIGRLIAEPAPDDVVCTPEGCRIPEDP